MAAEGAKAVQVRGGGEDSVNQWYSARDPAAVPAGFARTCDEMGWPSEATWRRLSDGQRPWYEAPNEAYMYWNRGDGKWWIDVPDGAGAYIAQTDSLDPPAGGWQTLPGKRAPVPAVLVVPAGDGTGDL